MSIIFTPLKIGSMALKNRIVMPGLTSNFAGENGEVTNQLIAFLSERAKGDTALLFVESAFTDISGKGTPRQVGIHQDEMVHGLKRLTDALHVFGAKVGIQIMHCGRQMTSMFSGMQPIAPSAIPCPVVGVMPRELTVSEIKEQIEYFAEASRRAVEAGFDCIEFVASHGYLISNFLSSFSNHRSDEYGGDFEGRFRFLKEIILRTKQLIGDFPLIIRLNAAEYVESGIEIEEAKKIAIELEKLGIHAIDVSVSVKASYHYLSASTGEPVANQAGLAEQIKEAVSIPVITAGRILDHRTAEQILVNGQADLVAIGRALIADPQLVRKMSTNEEIIPCISCNACNQRTKRPQIVCAINSNTGSEELLDSSSVVTPLKVAVLGGGFPALEAAKVAAQRGHHVNLFPMGPIGGLSYYRGLVPGMEEFHKPINYYQNQFKKLGVVLNDNNFDESFYDVIIDGTWGKSSQDCAITVLQGEEVSHTIGILDDGLLSCEVSLYLLNQGKKVEILSRESKKIRDAHPTVAFYLLERLYRAGVSFVDSLNPQAYDHIISPTVFNQKSEIKSSLPIYELGDAYEASELAERVFKAGAIARMI